MSLSEIISSMNPTLWVFAALLIGWVLVQAFWFLKLALSFNKKNQLATQAEISQAAKTGFISVLGPAVSVVVVAISLIAMVGPAVTFMRCGVIGAPMWELMMAEYSAQSAGVAFGGEGFTESIFVLCIFGMTFASAPYFINTMITLKPMDQAVINAEKASKAGGAKKESFIPTLGTAAMMGLMGYSIFDYFKALPTFCAFAAAILASEVLGRMAVKHKGLAQWSMAIAMIIGMATGQIVTMLLA